MAFVDWSNKYTVHDKDLDEHHQHLFAIISELHKALLTSHNKEQIGHTIASLIEYTKRHFAAEEQAMESCGYPGFSNHKAAHDRLIQRVNQFDAEFHKGSSAVASDLFVFLVKEWLTGHIIGMDKNFALFLSARRLTRLGSRRPAAYG